MQNFMQISPRGLLGQWVKYTQNFFFIYAFFSSPTHRLGPLGDFALNVSNDAVLHKEVHFGG